MVLGLSEQAKLIYLQERIKEAKEREKSGRITFIVGVVLATIGFGLGGILGLGGTLIGMLGVLLAGIGFFELIYYTYQYYKLLDQLKKMATTFPTCPKCGKEIPQGNYAFCPFCGAPLKS